MLGEIALIYYFVSSGQKKISVVLFYISKNNKHYQNTPKVRERERERNTTQAVFADNAKIIRR